MKPIGEAEPRSQIISNTKGESLAHFTDRVGMMALSEQRTIDASHYNRGIVHSFHVTTGMAAERFSPAEMKEENKQ